MESSQHHLFIDILIQVSLKDFYVKLKMCKAMNAYMGSDCENQQIDLVWHTCIHLLRHQRKSSGCRFALG